MLQKLERQVILPFICWWISNNYRVVYIFLFNFQEDVDKAVAAARAAFNRKSEWRTMDASRRGELMVKVCFWSQYSTFFFLSWPKRSFNLNPFSSWLTWWRLTRPTSPIWSLLTMASLSMIRSLIWTAPSRRFGTTLVGVTRFMATPSLLVSPIVWPVCNYHSM